jgi:hypothetical protein
VFAVNGDFTPSFWLSPNEVYLIIFKGLYASYRPALQGYLYAPTHANLKPDQAPCRFQGRPL